MGLNRDLAALTERSKLNGSLRKNSESGEKVDLILFNGAITRAKFYRIHHEIKEKQKNERCLLVLTTLGGDIHSAFRIAKLLQTQYPKEFSIAVLKECKDAGILVALASDSLFAAPSSAEFGPLNHLRDNVSDKKEVARYQGTNPVFREGLDILRDKVLVSVQDFAKAHHKSSVRTFVSNKENWRQTNQLVAHLFQPCFGRIDLFELGNYSRAISTAKKYAQDLGCRNVHEASLQELIDNCYEPNVVLDFSEAQRIFKVVNPAPERLVAKVFKELFRMSDANDESVSLLDTHLN